jgi:hypothetical protein
LTDTKRRYAKAAKARRGARRRRARTLPPRKASELRARFMAAAADAPARGAGCRVWYPGGASRGTEGKVMVVVGAELEGLLAR